MDWDMPIEKFPDSVKATLWLLYKAAFSDHVYRISSALKNSHNALQNDFIPTVEFKTPAPLDKTNMDNYRDYLLPPPSALLYNTFPYRAQ